MVILGNLLENSLEALQKYRQGEKNLYLLISGKNDVLKIVVQDSGPGIPMPIRGEIFENGFSTKEADGHGLGLYIVKAHIEAAGGAISINCPPEKAPGWK